MKYAIGSAFPSSSFDEDIRPNLVHCGEQWPMATVVELLSVRALLAARWGEKFDQDIDAFLRHAAEQFMLFIVPLLPDGASWDEVTSLPDHGRGFWGQCESFCRWTRFAAAITRLTRQPPSPSLVANVRVELEHVASDFDRDSSRYWPWPDDPKPLDLGVVGDVQQEDATINRTAIAARLIETLRQSHDHISRRGVEEPAFVEADVLPLLWRVAHQVAALKTNRDIWIVRRSDREPGDLFYNLHDYIPYSTHRFVAFALGIVSMDTHSDLSDHTEQLWQGLAPVYEAYLRERPAWAPRPSRLE